VSGLAERIAQPFETFVKTVSGCGAGGLDVLKTILVMFVERGSSRDRLPRRAV